MNIAANEYKPQSSPSKRLDNLLTTMRAISTDTRSTDRAEDARHRLERNTKTTDDQVPIRRQAIPPTTHHEETTRSFAR